MEEQIKECDYCSVESHCFEEYTAKSGNIRKLQINFIYKSKMIYVKTETEDGNNFTFGLEERIHFCPMCGRKL